MGNKLMAVGIAVLAVIAVVLGYLIYQETLGTKTQSLSQTQTIPQTPTSPQTTAGVPSEVQLSSGENAAIAADRKNISEYPGPGAPEEQAKEFQEIIDRNAQASNTLDITKCETDPMVLIVKRGSSIEIVNNDSSGSNTILFGPDDQYEVAPRDTINIVVNLDLGVNRYRCTAIGGSPIVGAFVVTE